MFRVELRAFEAIAMLPLALPAAVGEKTTLKFIVWPAARVTGGFKPDALNPGPVTLIAETVRLSPPEFVIASVSVCEVPARTSTKLKLAGVAVNCPELAPVPANGKVTVVELGGEADFLPPELVTSRDTVPLSAPMAGGAKVTLKVRACPPPRVTGKLRPARVNPVPERET
jgi:hypothetical protein